MNVDVTTRWGACASRGGVLASGRRRWRLTTMPVVVVVVVTVSTQSRVLRKATALEAYRRRQEPATGRAGRPAPACPT